MCGMYMIFFFDLKKICLPLFKRFKTFGKKDKFGLKPNKFGGKSGVIRFSFFKNCFSLRIYCCDFAFVDQHIKTVIEKQGGCQHLK